MRYLLQCLDGRNLGEPGLFPVLADALDFLDHHFREQVKSLVFAVGPVGILFSVPSHKRH